MAFPDTSRRSTLREYYEALLIALILVNFAKIFVFQFFKIPSGSMLDNLLIGDHIVVNKYIYGEGLPAINRLLGLRDIRRGDVAVFRYPVDPSIDYIKRVVGLPGETLLIRDKTVFIDGHALAEPYKLHVDSTIYPYRQALPEPYRSRDQFGPIQIPAGQYFMMGDNRDRSSDSRFWGTVPRSMIKGKAFIVYWSFRGTPLPAGSSGADRVRELIGVVRYFFARTRWNRTFFVIDSRYHYGADEEPKTQPPYLVGRMTRWQR